MKITVYIKYIFLLLFIQLSFCLPAQNQKKMDSLSLCLESSGVDSLKYDVLLKLALEIKNYSIKKALGYMDQALVIATHLNSPKRIAKAHNRIADVYLQELNPQLASNHCFIALDLFEKLNDSAAVADCLYNIGKIYSLNKKDEEALRYFNKSLAIETELNKKEQMCWNYNEIGIIARRQKRFKDAVLCYRNTLKMQEELGDTRNTAAIYGNLSIVYYEMNNLNMSIEAMMKAIKFAEAVDNKLQLAQIYTNLGGLYIETKKYDKANTALQKALTYATEIDYKNIKQMVYANIANLNEHQADFAKAYEYTLLASALNDSINKESNVRNANELIAKFESDQKELKIENLEKGKALSEENLRHERNFKIYLSLFGLLIVASIALLIRSFKQTKKNNLALSIAYKQIEEKNKEIKDSINYSKHIQEASLPSKELKYELFHDIFILFQPKDIVSGDFYWDTEKNGKRIIACCDCTGHGVPGALMSMIGSNILNQLVNENGITAADEILNELHKEIRKALKQDEQTNGSKDGMDIALIVFNSATEIEYAGAQRPLWIVGNSELSLTEIKADKFPIGGYQSEAERKFTKHVFNLFTGDCVYIASDGYADQFGGVAGKKFMTKRMKELLINNCKKPMSEQEVLLMNSIKKWMGNYEQVDDMLVIGIRV
jgi:serine phosphatase RsbU (regulator of sigma subunit)